MLINHIVYFTKKKVACN